MFAPSVPSRRDVEGQEPQRIDLSEARKFLACLGKGEPFTYQTFGDVNKQDRALAKVRHGELDRHCEALERLNSRGAGVFSMVNAGDGKGRRELNVQRVRAVFVDLDGAPLEPVTQATLRPHMTIESSPGKYHAYWCIHDLPREAFSVTQMALAQRFDGDPAVKDLPRVMRLPGFIHQKNRPFRTRIRDLRDTPPYPASALLNAFEIDLNASAQAFSPTAQIEEGSRNLAIFQMTYGFLADGLPQDTVLQRLLSANRMRCNPPLPKSEVIDIWKRVCEHRPANNPLAKLFNNPALTPLSFPARWLYGIAHLRAAGSVLPFSLTLTDCESMGYGRKQRQRALEDLLAAGLLVQNRPYFGGVGGGTRQCALFTLGVEMSPNPNDFRGQISHGINETVEGERE